MIKNFFFSMRVHVVVIVGTSQWGEVICSEERGSQCWMLFHFRYDSHFLFFFVFPSLSLSITVPFQLTPPKPRDSPSFRQEWRDDRDKNKDTLGGGKKKTYVHVCWGGVSFPRWLISSQ